MADRTPWEQLADQLGAGASKYVPEIFETLADENEARLLLAASPPATLEELAERTGMGTGEIEKMIDPLFRKGMLFKSQKKDGTRYYRVRHVMQFHDATAVMNDPPRKMLELWKQYTEKEWAETSNTYADMLGRSPVRVLPVNVNVDVNTQILAFEDVRSLVDSARNIAVTRCSCRVIDGACGKSVEVCMQLDKAADYAIERGTGRPLTKEEAIEMLEACEKEGLVHCSENKQALGTVICNCCQDCCINWPALDTGVGRFIAPSRYRAAIDAEDCNGCADCLERCFFGALTMEGEDGDALAVVDAEKCMGCGACQVVCPPVAISMEAVRPEEFVPAG
jgi:Fe-S-cluster-containing hydrogenase component 2/predicted transcriptional regulator